MKRFYAGSHGLRRFGYLAPHDLNRVTGYRGGIRL